MPTKRGFANTNPGAKASSPNSFKAWNNGLQSASPTRRARLLLLEVIFQNLNCLLNLSVAPLQEVFGGVVHIDVWRHAEVFKVGAVDVPQARARRADAGAVQQLIGPGADDRAIGG